MSCRKCLVSRCLIAGALSLATLGVALTQNVHHAEAQTRQDTSSPLENAVKRGDYELASQLARSRDDAFALTVRAQLSRMNGELKQTLKLSELAMSKAVDSKAREEALVVHAQTLEQQGEWEKAVELLRQELKDRPDAHHARLELGRILHIRGQRKEAEQLLDHFGDLFNNGRLKAALDISYVAESMRILGNFQDANYAYTEAYKTDQRDPDILARWGNLYLDKYNAEDARKNFEEALQINANHLESLIGLTSLSLMRRSDVENTQQLLKKIEEIAPGSPDLHVLKGYLALRDEDADVAKKHFDKALEFAPEHLDALTMLGAYALFTRQPDLFETYKAKLLEVSPGNAQPIADIADFVSNTRMEHDEALNLYREALKVDGESAQALMGIGFVLSRTNHDDEALDYFQKSFDLDPYNQRVYLVLEVYDKLMPKYSFKEYDRFKFRAKNEEFNVVDMFAAPVIEQAMALYDQKYNFKPDENLAIEIYPDPMTFAVRSVGVPYIGAHGLCFGPLVTMHSPSEGNFNWRMVLWHEMAHVYHIQLSNSRVPRWFTEGLAEYETNVHDPSWRRYYDPDVAVMLRQDKIPTVLDLSKGFTHSNSQAEVVRAYHLASLSIHFIAQEWGFDSIVAMLKEWGNGEKTREVLANVLEVTPEEFDKRFELWLVDYLVDFNGQISFDFDAIPAPDEVDRMLKLNRRDTDALLYRAIYSMRGGDIQRAEESLRQALTIAPKDPEIHYVAVFMMSAQGKSREVLKHGEKVLEAFKDSYDLRVYMARASMFMEDVEGARVHLEAATQLNPNGQEAWFGLVQLARQTSDDELKEMSYKKLYALQAHDASVANEMYQMAHQKGDSKQVEGALLRWADIDPFDTRLHQHIINHWSKVEPNKVSNAYLERSYRSLIQLSELKREELYREAAKVFEARKMSDALKRLKEDAADVGVTL